MPRVSEELERRAVYLDDLERLFMSKPGVWIPWRDLAHVGGVCAWRTRCSDLRTKRKMIIEWNRNVRESCYRYLPYAPLGPDAATPRSEKHPARQLDLIARSRHAD